MTIRLDEPIQSHRFPGRPLVLVLDLEVVLDFALDLDGGVRRRSWGWLQVDLRHV